MSGADFTADRRLVWLSLLAIPVGLVCGAMALLLLRLIGFFTELFYFGRLAIPHEIVSPAGSPLGLWMIAIPPLGGLIIGLMARYGSDRIRGHGIPEAIEAILIGSSRMSPRVAVLKPLSSAISIGSGGPFGAEGPIIMTGGACGSLIAQTFHLTAAERKTLLVAGAAGGMSATFGTPVAAVLLAVELLLFEWKPRSFVPVAIASAVAALARPYLGLAASPLFPVTLHTEAPGLGVLLGAVPAGMIAGFAAMLLTRAVYATEDAFARLPIHWMWWPMLGGVVVGIGGWFEPRALGVGYDLIADLLRGNYLASALVPLMLVKALIWSVALGSGTSGGVLAPLLILGGSLGGLESSFMPGGDPALWPLLGMASVMGGTMRSPLTGIVFALELTDDVRLLLPLLIAVVVAHAFTVLVMKRSILTEKVARRGHHVSREYSLDPLERLLARDVMSTEVITVPASMPVRQLVREYFLGTGAHRHQGYPVVDRKGAPVGMVTKSDLLQEWLGALLQDEAADTGPVITWDVASRPALAIGAGDSCRTAAERMAQSNVGRLLVVDSNDPKRLLGVITRSDLLKARARALEEESNRERYIRLRSR
ncbi:MAG TPA: chloride channel protein [Myxococcota bacterium]|nr:chloride channel protein [Myxococcota bacterium]